MLGHSFSSVFIIFLLTATGYFCAARGWMTAESKNFLSKFLLNIAVPANCLYTMRNSLTVDMLAGAVPFLVVTFVGNSLMFALSYLAARIMKVARRQLGGFMVMCSLSNCVFVGLPVCRELFGEVAIPYAMLYYLVAGCFTQSVALVLIRYSGDDPHARGENILLKLLKTPPFVTTIVSITIVLADVQIPAVAMRYLGYMSGTVSPIALMVSGFIICDIGLKALKPDKMMGVVVLFRFAVSTALFVALCAVFGVTGLPRSVMAVQCSMPVVTQTVVASAVYGADEELAARGVAISTLASFLTTPIIASLI